MNDVEEDLDRGDQVAEEGDWLARQFFSRADLESSPEEYAASHIGLWGCFSMHLYRYRDQEMGAWVRRLGEIFSSESEIERCRRRFLSPRESATVERQAAEGL